jgi:hypothetical protein
MPNIIILLEKTNAMEPHARLMVVEDKHLTGVCLSSPFK